MTTTNNGITRAMALRTAIDVCTSAGIDPAIIEKLEHMLQLIQKPASKSGETESAYKARMRGERAAQFVAELGHPVTAREFLSLTTDVEVTSVQGATAALRKAVSLGLLSSWFEGSKKSTMITLYGVHRSAE